MAKEETYSIESLFENLAAGHTYQYLVANSTRDMERIFREIKFPFRIISAYAMNGKHVVLGQFTREIKKKEK